MPQSADTTASPPSVTISSTGWSDPVVRISRHRSRAWASSLRPSTITRSVSGASRSALPSAGRTLTEWLSSASPGSTSADGCSAPVRSSRVLKDPPRGAGLVSDVIVGPVAPLVCGWARISNMTGPLTAFQHPW